MSSVASNRNCLLEVTLIYGNISGNPEEGRSITYDQRFSDADQISMSLFYHRLKFGVTKSHKIIAGISEVTSRHGDI